MKMEIHFSYFSTKTYVVGTQKNGFIEHPKHKFNLMGKKIVTILLSKNSYHNLCTCIWLYAVSTDVS